MRPPLLLLSLPRVFREASRFREMSDRCRNWKSRRKNKNRVGQNSSFGKKSKTNDDRVGRESIAFTRRATNGAVLLSASGTNNFEPTKRCLVHYFSWQTPPWGGKEKKRVYAIPKSTNTQITQGVKNARQTRDLNFISLKRTRAKITRWVKTLAPYTRRHYERYNYRDTVEKKEKKPYTICSQKMKQQVDKPGPKKKI